jgi:hypothetical protein
LEQHGVPGPLGRPSVGAIDQQPAYAHVAHFGEGDLLRTVGHGKPDQNQDLMTSQAAITAGIGRYSLPPRIAPVVSGSDSVPATGAPIGSGATQFPAQSFVPFTVPTGRHSLDCFGLAFFRTASRGVCSSCIHPVALAATCDHSAHIQPHGNKLCHTAFKFQRDLFAE